MAAGRQVASKIARNHPALSVSFLDPNRVIEPRSDVYRVPTTPDEAVSGNRDPGGMVPRAGGGHEVGEGYLAGILECVASLKAGEIKMNLSNQEGDNLLEFLRCQADRRLASRQAPSARPCCRRSWRF
jgi:hypothetical protein